MVSDLRRGDDEVRASICGEIDLHNSPILREQLLQIIRDDQPKRLTLDLGEVPYMDSSAIAVLVELLKEMRKLSGGDKDSSHVALVELQPRVRGLLHIARLDAIFDLETSSDNSPDDAS